MKLRPLLIASIVGIVAQITCGTVIGVVSYFPVRDAATTGTLFEPLVPFSMFALLLGILGLIIDLIAGWLTGRWGGSARDGAISGALTQLVSGLVNGLVAVIVLYIALQQTLPDSDSTVRGLSESYNGFLLLGAGAIGVVGWLIGVGAGGVVGMIGGRVGARVRPKE